MLYKYLSCSLQHTHCRSSSYFPEMALA